MLRALAHDPSNADKEPISIAKLMTDITMITSNRMSEVGIEFSALGDFKDLWSQGQPNQLAQAVLHLLDNAINSLKRPVAQAPKWIRVSAQVQDDRICIRVQDSGPGISREREAQVFRPFYTTAEIGKGVGLGLNLAEAIVRKHGGRLAINRSISDSCLEFTIPLVRGKNQ
jgi:two-component system C4-dicarboxylate transport sensor histidine kinase DctB